MRVIMKRPGEPVSVGDLADYNAMHEYICGCFDTVPLLGSDGSRYLIVCNDDFLSNGSSYNMFLNGVEFYGNIFICGVGEVNGEHDFVGLDGPSIFDIARNLCFSDRDCAILLQAGLAASASDFVCDWGGGLWRFL